jgi:hypothetical protein
MLIILSFTLSFSNYDNHLRSDMSIIITSLWLSNTHFLICIAFLCFVPGEDGDVATAIGGIGGGGVGSGGGDESEWRGWGWIGARVLKFVRLTNGAFYAYGRLQALFLSSSLVFAFITLTELGAVEAM